MNELYVVDEDEEGSPRAWPLRQEPASKAWAFHPPEPVQWLRAEGFNVFRLPLTNYAIKASVVDFKWAISFWDVGRDAIVWQWEDCDEAFVQALQRGLVRFGGVQNPEVIFGLTLNGVTQLRRSSALDGKPIGTIALGAQVDELNGFDARLGTDWVAMETYRADTSRYTLGVRQYGRSEAKSVETSDEPGGGQYLLDNHTLLIVQDGKITARDMATWRLTRAWSKPGMETWHLPEFVVADDHAVFSDGPTKFQISRDVGSGLWAKELTHISECGAECETPAYSPDGTLLVSMTSHKEIKVWESKDPTRVEATIAASLPTLNRIAIDLDRPRVAFLNDHFAASIDFIERRVKSYRLPTQMPISPQLAWSSDAPLLLGAEEYCPLKAGGARCHRFPGEARGGHNTLVRGATICRRDDGPMNNDGFYERHVIRCFKIGDEQSFFTRECNQWAHVVLGPEGRTLAIAQSPKPDESSEWNVEAIDLESNRSKTFVLHGIMQPEYGQSPDLVLNGRVVDVELGKVGAVEKGRQSRARRFGGDYWLKQLTGHSSAIMSGDSQLGTLELTESGVAFDLDPVPRTQNSGGRRVEHVPGRWGTTAIEMIVGRPEDNLRCVSNGRFLPWDACRHDFERPGMLWEVIK